MIKILVTGTSGQVGWELLRSLQPLGQVRALTRQDADLSRPESLRQPIQAFRPDVIVNSAAYTAVDKAEDHEQEAMAVNADSPQVLAEEAEKSGALLIHYSTDYVFDGENQTPYKTIDKPNPINVYGKTKLAGEQAIQASNADYLILRTSWVYANRGTNFLLSMMRLIQERETLGIVDDQIGAPTWARLIADATAQIITKALTERQENTFEPGVYHLTSTGKTSWKGFADEIKNQMLQKEKTGKLATINAIETKDYPTPAARPKSSTLDLTELETRFNLALPDWKLSLEQCMADFKY
jgi:dTDP-4-dehydrorhamnose reductase